MRFEYDISGDEVTIFVNGRDKLNENGKFIDAFTTKKFNISIDEIPQLEELLEKIIKSIEVRRCLDDPEPLFGTHLREAKEAVDQLFSKNKEGKPLLVPLAKEIRVLTGKERFEAIKKLLFPKNNEREEI
ncbi:hypothetical protein A2Z67_04765 [Candidatus Woesebacteria bacterium RBG_13_36_22]|uniref:Uncharacterized protein n=1 Tax=Candidatus Woesebacteria bacterium RBG_13_36_22 TaxID=1802478 RepID=A0A1F7X2A6_9BACT|nr:MAG: hypothetical protein A2Z67_04765 [Candidatus Woesebacteria bacterium RBG_13_36_22]